MYRTQDDFKRYIDQRAQGEKKRFHHIYRWGDWVGNQRKAVQTRIWKSKGGRNCKNHVSPIKDAIQMGLFCTEAEWMGQGFQQL